jgi:hypothetical protein
MGTKQETDAGKTRQNGTKGLESEISTFGYEKYQKGALSENPFAY